MDRLALIKKNFKIPTSDHRLFFSIYLPRCVGKLRAKNFKDAVEQDVNTQIDGMKRCRSSLEMALTNDDEDELVKLLNVIPELCDICFFKNSELKKHLVDHISSRDRLAVPPPGED